MARKDKVAQKGPVKTVEVKDKSAGPTPVEVGQATAKKNAEAEAKQNG